MSDDEQKINRRLFLQHSAVITAASATWYSVALKTDAIAQVPATFGPGGENNVIPYQYDSPP